MIEDESRIITPQSILQDFNLDNLDNIKAYFEDADYIIERIEATPTYIKLQVEQEGKRYTVLIQGLISEVE